MAVDPYAHVLAHPGSLDARRALLATWKAKGDARAELIEKQLEYREFARKQLLADARARQLSSEIHALIYKYKRAWAGDLAEFVTDYSYHRGLLAEVDVPGERFPRIASKLFASAPIQHLTITKPLGSIEALFASPYLERLVSLGMPDDGLGDRGAITLARSPHVRNLRWLDLGSNEIGQAGVEALAASPYLASARFIGLGGNPVNPTPWVALDSGFYQKGQRSPAQELERTFGKRPWLDVPENPEDWPPDRDELAITP